MKRTFVIFACAFAVNGAFAQAASSASASDAASTAATPATRHEARVEQRITYLHQQLKITPAQETQWNAFADAMRADAETMGKLYEQRMKGVESETALDNMHEYAQLTQAHADGAKKLAAAFEPLYSSLSPQQKQLADSTFREQMHRHGGRQTQKMQKPAQQ